MVSVQSYLNLCLVCLDEDFKIMDLQLKRYIHLADFYLGQSCESLEIQEGSSGSVSFGMVADEHSNFVVYHSHVDCSWLFVGLPDMVGFWMLFLCIDTCSCNLKLNLVAESTDRCSR